MTEVEFHTGVADSVGFACRLLRKAQRRGVRVLVIAQPDTLAELDRHLWTFEARDFVPHVRVPDSAATVRARTPIWLAESVEAAAVDDAPRLVVNVGADAPAGIGSLDRLIEIVGVEPGDVQRGRERWRRYKSAGLNIVHHDAGKARG